MVGRLPREWWSDARHYQIAALSTLLVFNLGWLGFGARPLNSALAITGALSGSLLIFAFFMISDPRTTPDSRLGRFVFTIAVALLGHYLAFFVQMRPALYVALIALSPLTLIIDRVLPAERFAWSRPAIQGAQQ
jgi:Na+-translocating ferredoxin:NAD+ oxidoreductase RnfD subunit